jgi:transposase
MSNRSIAMHEYRQIILTMRLGESDRAIGRLGLMSRTKTKQIRAIALKQGWLDSSLELPTDEQLSHFFSKQAAKRSSESLSTPYKEEMKKWVEQGIQATTIHQTLARKYGFTGSYNSVQRFVKKIKARDIPCSTVLDFSPADSAQVDFGLGPVITDVHSGEIFKTWIFVMVLSWSRH